MGAVLPLKTSEDISSQMTRRATYKHDYPVPEALVSVSKINALELNVWPFTWLLSPQVLQGLERGYLGDGCCQLFCWLPLAPTPVLFLPHWPYFMFTLSFNSHLLPFITIPYFLLPFTSSSPLHLQECNQVRTVTSIPSQGSRYFTHKIHHQTVIKYTYISIPYRQQNDKIIMKWCDTSGFLRYGLYHAIVILQSWKCINTTNVGLNFEMQPGSLVIYRFIVSMLML